MSIQLRNNHKMLVRKLFMPQQANYMEREKETALTLPEKKPLSSRTYMLAIKNRNENKQKEIKVDRHFRFMD